MICTDGSGTVALRAGELNKDYPVKPIETVSTVGAGDNFNAGIIYGLLKNRIRRADLAELTERDWDSIMQCGLDFSAEACRNIGNSVSPEFAQAYINKH